ncbi:hypothetical protein [Allokutzneria sp. NRRL B-24872]|uniref:hypothetical protein n=1 Tax=Allokutzneria sp. NRRL B-24872 TaxID=1137961 RepID=UPI0011777A4F|nr:hypothetical protein [Allokutzneria sp. NRRL B-24872]
MPFSLALAAFLLLPALPAVATAPPAQPTELGVEDGLIPCTVGPERPFVFTKTPRLRARVSAGDGGFLNAGFRVLKGTADAHTWDGNEQRVTDTPSGSFAEVTVAAGLIEDGQVHTWHMWAENAAGRTWSKFCEFEVDSVSPVEPEVSSPDYPEATARPGPGRPGTFTFRANGSTDVAKYQYTFSGEETGPWTDVRPDNFGGSVSVTWAPDKPGTHYLLVRSVNRAGNTSPIYWYEIRVRSA